MCKRVQDIKQLITIAWPILVAQLAQTMMGFVDTIMAGRVSALDVAAVALGNSIWLPTIIVIGGTIMAVPALVAHRYGANQITQIRPLIHQTIYMALMCSVFAMLCLFGARYGLAFFSLAPELQDLTVSYLVALMCGAPAFLLFQSMRSLTEGMAITKPSMVIGFIGFMVNIPVNYLFIYGGLGVPAMGGVGSGIATAIVYWVMFLSLAVYVARSKRLTSLRIFSGFQRIDFSVQRQLFAQGTPIALAVFLEVAVFAFIAMMLAPMGAEVIASNQIAVNFTMITMMIPLAIGSSVTVRVGYHLGQGNTAKATSIIHSGVLIIGMTGAVIMVLIFLFNHQIASLYTTDAKVKSLGAGLLLYSALFQLPNAIQTIYVAGLRGFKDTLPIFYVALICYWIIGMTIGYTLAKTDLIVPQMGASGLWTGFIIGLLCAAFSLKSRLAQRHEQSAERLSVS